jgi:hypothetical protein
MPKRLLEEEPGDPNEKVLLQIRIPRWVKNRAIVSSSTRQGNLTLWLCEAILSLSAIQARQVVPDSRTRESARAPDEPVEATQSSSPVKRKRALRR